LRKKRSSILIDANVLVAFLDGKDVHHEKAKESIFSHADYTDLIVLLPILAEAYSVIARRCKERKYDCREALQRMRELEDLLTVEELSYKNYHGRIVKGMLDNPELNYNDWLLVLYALDSKMEVLSLDNKLKEELSKGRHSL